MYAVDLETRDEAEWFLATDPFAQVDLFERVMITRWRKACFDGECCL
ncbi:YciI-like protein (fragment) [Paraburkholderia ribeironis]|uniref:YciI-like protein n=1 Tax=Paraburkholderia ribeironis TaxID=1247936 RepID=A0A1N7SQB5_9BURK